MKPGTGLWKQIRFLQSWDGFVHIPVNPLANANIGRKALRSTLWSMQLENMELKPD